MPVFDVNDQDEADHRDGEKWAVAFRRKVFYRARGYQYPGMTLTKRTSNRRDPIDSWLKGSDCIVEHKARRGMEDYPTLYLEVEKYEEALRLYVPTVVVWHSMDEKFSLLYWLDDLRFIPDLEVKMVTDRRGPSIGESHARERPTFLVPKDILGCGWQSLIAEFAKHIARGNKTYDYIGNYDAWRG